jgi:hypothetical protein
MQQCPPAERPHPRALGADIRVLRRRRLDGLIHEYFRVARDTGLMLSSPPVDTSAFSAYPGLVS